MTIQAFLFKPLDISLAQPRSNGVHSGWSQNRADVRNAQPASSQILIQALSLASRLATINDPDTRKNGRPSSRWKHPVDPLDSGNLRDWPPLDRFSALRRWHRSGCHPPAGAYFAARQSINDRQRTAAVRIFLRTEAVPSGDFTWPRPSMACDPGRIPPPQSWIAYSRGVPPFFENSLASLCGAISVWVARLQAVLKYRDIRVMVRESSMRTFPVVAPLACLLTLYGFSFALADDVPGRQWTAS